MIIITDRPIEGYETLRAANNEEQAIYAVKIPELEPEEILQLIYPAKLLRIVTLPEPKGVKFLRDRIGDPPYRGILLLDDLRRTSIREFLGNKKYRFFIPRKVEYDTDKVVEIYNEMQEELDSLEYYAFFCPYVRLNPELIRISSEFQCLMFDAMISSISIAKRLESTIKIAAIVEDKTYTSLSGLANLLTLAGVDIIFVEGMYSPYLFKPSLSLILPISSREVIIR